MRQQTGGARDGNDRDGNDRDGNDRDGHDSGSEAADRPSGFPWPPVVFLGALLAGLSVEWLSPLQAPGWLGNAAVRALGVCAVTVGLILDGAAILTMRRAGTTIFPTRRTAHLLTSGPFGITRNPIYLGNTIVLVGIGLVFAAEWLVPAALVAAILVDRLAVRREERHLAARFGEAFHAYARQTPRWIGPI